MKLKSFLLLLFVGTITVKIQAQEKVWISGVSTKGTNLIGVQSSGVTLTGVDGGGKDVLLEGVPMANQFYRDVAEQLKMAGYDVIDWVKPKNDRNDYIDSVQNTGGGKLSVKQKVNMQNQQHAQQQQTAANMVNSPEYQAKQKQQNDAVMAAMLAKIDTSTAQGKAQKAQLITLMAGQGQQMQQGQQSMLQTQKGDTLDAAKVQQQEDEKQEQSVKYDLTFADKESVKQYLDAEAREQNNQGAVPYQGDEWIFASVQSTQTDYEKLDKKKFNTYESEEAMNAQICKQNGAGKCIYFHFKLEEVYQKALSKQTTFCLSALITTEDPDGKRHQIFIGEKSTKRGTKRDKDSEYEESVDGNLTPETILAAMPGILKHFAKKCVDEMASQSK
ncbi:MAG: hypothetical protein ACLQQ4_03930 [Bacteroidia bacterium]